jgi:hypothetical protein
MRLEESAPCAYGELTIFKEYQDGNQEHVLTERNTITMPSRRHHLAFLYDNTTPFDLLNTFKVGTGGVLDPEGLRPIAPDPTNNDLYAPINTGINTDVTITPSDPTDDTQVYIQIVYSLSQDEGNGQEISETALFKESGDMFNIKTFRSISKTDAFSLIFQWRIRYI